MQSFRSQLIARRSYNRPLNDEGTVFETWEQTVARVIQHQRWLWERAQDSKLDLDQEAELDELRFHLLNRELGLAGRTMWLGGTDTAQSREATQFNCSFTEVRSIHDVVDGFWLLLQGCGVGFRPVSGILNGFTAPIETVEVIRSKKVIGDPKGKEKSTETFRKGVWTIVVGDSAEAWAKLPGKLLAQKRLVHKLVLDFSEIRAAGYRLRGYGWLSSGDHTISQAMVEIIKILNNRAGQLLTKIDILDIMNWLGTTLSSRRSAEIAIMDAIDPEAEAFALAKSDLNTNWHRSQSNNTILFHQRPSKLELHGLFAQMIAAGGSEPGFGNAEAALKRAPWFRGFNPCAEILLGDKSFCNLVEPDWGKFVRRLKELLRVIWLAARANYRQTCVNLRDGVLSDSWHELNEFLRLCGVGATGIVRWMDKEEKDKQADYARQIRAVAIDAANSMAVELGLPLPKLVTTVKPSGTWGKIMDTPEGGHRPLGRFIFNTVIFPAHDPLVPQLRAANYNIRPNPYDPLNSVLVVLPVEFDDLEFTTVTIGDEEIEINTESAVTQLERYKFLMDNYVDHNCSITVSYDPSEVPEIVDWLYGNWDTFVGVSWLFRDDPTKTAEDLGYAYLPQKVVSKRVYDEYVSTLLPVDIDAGNSHELVDFGECATGACPIR